VDEIAGEKNGRRFFPLVGALFLFIIASNYFGLLPLVNSIGVAEHDPAKHTGIVASGSSSFATIQPNAKQVKEGEESKYEELSDSEKEHLVTVKPYLRSPNTDVNSPLALALVSFVFVEFWGLSTLGIHYLGKFLAFPPFAKGFSPINIFVGFLELISEFIRIISFTFRLFGNIFAGDVLILFMTFLVPFLAPTIFYGLETFVGFIQASVFALLTLVFAVMAVEPHDEGEPEAHGAHGAHAEAATH
jgi:F-type H+-transporting ATPase subunit a